MKWYVAFVQTGKEEAVKKRFCDLDINIKKCCVPKRKVPEKKNGIVYESIKILFPGYVFFCTEIDFRTYYQINSIPGVIKILNYSNKKDKLISSEESSHDLFFKSVPDEQMSIILEMLNENDIIDYLKILFRNEKVKVISGPCKGLEGRIKKIDKHKKRAKIQLDILGLEKIVDIGIEIIRPIISTDDTDVINNIVGNKMMDIEIKIKKIIIEILELPHDISLDNDLVNIGLDSISFIRLMVSLENDFGIEVPDEFLTMKKFSTIDELALLVTNQ
ncbi:acyl carrier protein [Paenibacillus uliginis N3/975]|uniref:Acyl carrier protein n=1 Tax=Paenibacillus uliginis N3/975 TaxID=1313296 RepID=A0A1X7GZ88_9BACL|nr:antiterminator LoaP [Paenibacillus uliginis]SMF76889.1 acyl carrier protein [Paenibacillus uliginis N3/975]